MQYCHEIRIVHVKNHRAKTGRRHPKALLDRHVHLQVGEVRIVIVYTRGICATGVKQGDVLHFSSSARVL